MQTFPFWMDSLALKSLAKILPSMIRNESLGFDCKTVKDIFKFCFCFDPERQSCDALRCFRTGKRKNSIDRTDTGYKLKLGTCPLILLLSAIY